MLPTATSGIASIVIGCALVIFRKWSVRESVEAKNWMFDFHFDEGTIKVKGATMFLNKQIPRWIKALPDEEERSALLLLAQSSQGPFEKPREMNFTLYDIEKGQELEEIVNRVAKEGWKTSIQPQADASRRLTLTATQDEYVINEAAYMRDTSFFKRIANLYKIGYDGWFASQ